MAISTRPGNHHYCIALSVPAWKNQVGMFSGAAVLVSMFTAAIASGQNNTNFSHLRIFQETIAHGGTLADAADKAGYLLVDGDMRTICWGPFTLSQLIEGSQVIVTGRVEGSSSLVRQRSEIETRYIFRPDRVLRGSVEDHFIFSATGGKVRFASGSIAEMRTTSYRHLKVGNRFLVFLNRASDGTFYIGGEPNGLFELNDGKVTPLALQKEMETPLHQLSEMTEDALIRQIRWQTAPEKKIDWLGASRARESSSLRPWLFTLGLMFVSLLCLFGAVHYRRLT